jgi:hypothetical protein
MLRSFFLSMILFLNFCPLALLGQTAGTGAMDGTVTDASGAAIAGVVVTATNTETGQDRSTITDSGGGYNFALVTPGIYQVMFSASGFMTLKITSVIVNVADTRVVNGKLEPGPQTEEMIVPWENQAVQGGGTASGGL